MSTPFAWRVLGSVVLYLYRVGDFDGDLCAMDYLEKSSE